MSTPTTHYLFSPIAIKLVQAQKIAPTPLLEAKDSLGLSTYDSFTTFLNKRIIANVTKVNSFIVEAMGTVVHLSPHQ